MKKIISYSYLKNTINKQTNKKYILKATCNGHTKKFLTAMLTLDILSINMRCILGWFSNYIKKFPCILGSQSYTPNSHSLEAKFTCLIISKIKSKTKVWMESTAYFIISYIINTAM